MGLLAVPGDLRHPQPVRALPQQGNPVSTQKGDIETYTSHFVAAQGISRILFIIFWIFTYAELNTDKAMSLLSEYVGYWFMTSQIIHLLIMGDFMYYWIKAMRHGTGVIQLPTYI